MGSTRPMPMKANTAARAVAHTALGCLSSEAFSASRVASAAGRVSAGWPCMGALLNDWNWGWILGLERRVDPADDRQGGGEGGAIVVGKRREDTGHDRVAALIGGFDCSEARLSEGHAHGTGISGVRFAA